MKVNKIQPNKNNSNHEYDHYFSFFILSKKKFERNILSTNVKELVYLVTRRGKKIVCWKDNYHQIFVELV